MSKKRDKGDSDYQGPRDESAPKPINDEQRRQLEEQREQNNEYENDSARPSQWRNRKRNQPGFKKPGSDGIVM